MYIRKPPIHTLAYLVDGILAHDRTVLSQAITLVESSLARDKALAIKLIDKILPYTGKSRRIGITGVPGVGKSTFIEVLGTVVTKNAHKLAVLAIDPSSTQSKGSIMGDKTRMGGLSRDPNVFIRPSPAGKVLGGLAQKTRETMLLCEATGFEVIFIETVGVGQSEVAVRGLVDFFLLLILANAGDALQGIKKGIIEMADLVAITKADGGNVQMAQKAATQYAQALHLCRAKNNNWTTPVITCSALENVYVVEIWQLVNDYFTQMGKCNFIQQQRKHQKVMWFQEQIIRQLTDIFYTNKNVSKLLPHITAQIATDDKSVNGALSEIFQAFNSHLPSG